MTDIQKYLGVAGGGKTYQIKQEIAAAVDSGLDPSEILVIAFNRHTRSELAKELGEEFTWGDCIEVSTLHSKALELCNDAGIIDTGYHSSDEIIEMGDYDDREYFQQFFEEYPGPYLRFEYQSGSSKDSVDYGDTPRGNQLLRAHSYCRSRAWDYEKVHQTPVDISLPLSEASQACEAWDEWKRQYSDDEQDIDGLVQHDDYVQLCFEEELLLDSSVEMLVVDEFQDFSSIQFGCYRNWRDENDLDRIILAGDPAQSIYGFRGATSTYLEETAGVEEYLTTTRRCAPKIMETARDVLAPLDYPTEEFSSKPMRSGEVDDEFPGNVQEHSLSRRSLLADLAANLSKHYLEGQEDELFILTRTNRDADRVEKVLRSSGIPYSRLGEETEWDDYLGAIYTVLERYDAGESVPPGVLELVLGKVTDGVLPEDVDALLRRSKLARELRRDGMWSDFPDSYTNEDSEVKPFVLDEWVDVDSSSEFVRRLELTPDEIELLTSALSSETQMIGHTSTPQVRIGTIHRSKGMEAEAVILLNGISKRQRDRFYGEYEAEERRLYYVACSRARDGLHIVHDALDHEYEFPPLS